MPRPDAVVNDARQSIWSSTGVDLHLSESLIALALLAIISAQKDWALRLANLAYLPLFAFYVLRTTFFWPVVVAYNFLETPRLQRRWIALLAGAWFLFAGGRAGVEEYLRPTANFWMGFGIGYLNPVPEAEFLASNHGPDRLYNSANAGSYLLWRLYPRYHVMADARSFPYLDWLADQFAFTTETSLKAFWQSIRRKWPSVSCKRFPRSTSGRPPKTQKGPSTVKPETSYAPTSTIPDRARTRSPLSS